MFVMLCAIWYHLYNLKTNKNTHGGVLLGRFSRFLNCTNESKSRNTTHISTQTPAGYSQEQTHLTNQGWLCPF